MEPAFPHICGVDLGSWTTKVSTLRQNKYFQVLTNQANFRETPSIVAFSDAQRLIGESGLIKMKSNFKNTLRAPLRIFSIAYHKHIFEQEQRYLNIPYQLDAHHNLKFKISARSICNQGQQFKIIRAQQFLIGLLQKVYQIIHTNTTQNKNNNYWLYIPIPSYFNNAEKKALKNCVQIAGFTTAGLIEQWEALSYQYQFFRFKQLQKQAEPRTVVFIDFGYSKFSVYICEIDQNNIQLIDQDILKCTGARNMDYMLAEFYIEMFYKQNGQNLRKNPKAMVKLYENIESQRKKLSANNQSTLNIQCIMGDHDLTYTMKREELQNIVMPIFGQIGPVLQNIRARVQPYVPYAKFHSVQIVGGASRMPFFQLVVQNIFGYQPSKTLNASEAIARGVTIAGTSRHGTLYQRISCVKKCFRFPVYACIHSLSKDQAYGKDLKKYNMNHKKIIWKQGRQIPSNQTLKIPNKSQFQVILFQQENITQKILGYYRFKQQDKLTFFIDNDNIIRARLSKKDHFDVYDMGDILNTQDLVSFRENKKKLEQIDHNYMISYQLRNNYQSQIYKIKENISGIWNNYLDNSQKQYLQDIINQCQQWLGQVNQPTTSQLTHRIESLDQITSFIRQKIKNK